VKCVSTSLPLCVCLDGQFSGKIRQEDVAPTQTGFQGLWTENDALAKEDVLNNGLAHEI
jgi:hypothetical protein